MAEAFSDAELERYARQIVLREIGGPGQRRLRRAKILVVGAGGLGAPALIYLAAAGVGEIGVLDDDIVSLSNLQRQIIHATSDAGAPKAESAAQTMRALNPEITVTTHQERLTPGNADKLISAYDLVLDCTDNMESRYLMNRAAIAHGAPLISAAITQWEGQISVFDPANGGPCFECVYPFAPAPGLAPSCAEGGVLGPLAGVMGTMLAVEAVKLITGAGKALSGRVLIYNALEGECHSFAAGPRAGCDACAALRA